MSSAFGSVAILGACASSVNLIADFVNNGFTVYLFDFAIDEMEPNLIAKQLIQDILEITPCPLKNKNLSERVIPANYIQDLHKLQDCKIVIDNGSDNFEWKRDSLVRISWYIKNETILLTNTNFIGINGLAEFLPNRLKLNFCGVNIGADSQLVELIPNRFIDEVCLEKVKTLFSSILQKQTVTIKDSTHFVSNRICLFALCSIIHYSEKYNLTPDVVDLLLYPIFGTYKGASFKYLDRIGLNRLTEQLKIFSTNVSDEPWLERFKIPQQFDYLSNKNAIKVDANIGFYKKENGKDLVFNLGHKNYRPCHLKLSEKNTKITNLASNPKYFHHLFRMQAKEAMFIWNLCRDLLYYSCYHNKSIVYQIDDIDVILEKAFGWKFKPISFFQRTDLEVFDYFNQESIDEKLSKQLSKIFSSEVTC